MWWSRKNTASVPTFDAGYEPKMMVKALAKELGYIWDDSEWPTKWVKICPNPKEKK